MTPAEIVAWRKRQGWTQEEAACAIGKSRRWWLQAERGEANISQTVQLALRAAEHQRELDWIDQISRA